MVTAGGSDSLSLSLSRGQRPYSRERSQVLRTSVQARDDARRRARQQLRQSCVAEGFEKARQAPVHQLPLDQARRLLQKADTAATTRLYSSSGVSSQYWLNPTSRYNLVDILGDELAGKLRQLERVALVSMQRRTECDTLLAVAQRKLADTCEKLAAEAAAAEEDEVRAVFESIDLDDNGTLDRDELKTAAERLGQAMSEEELDAAMHEMDEDGSGEVDYDEFLAWWNRRKAEGKGGLFGGLFSDPLEMSDEYLRMQIVIDKRKREAAKASAEAGGAAENLEAVSLEAGLRLRAFAEFERQHQLLDEQGGGTKPESAVDDNNPFNSFSSLFANKKSSNLPTPYDYEARVTGASISFLDRYSLNLSIAGTGTVRVLYADENLRIFVSPTDTNVTKGAEGWESEGLIVVQVRVGLVYDDWVDKL